MSRLWTLKGIVDLDRYLKENLSFKMIQLMKDINEGKDLLKKFKEF
jgi:hypothetical protein